MLIEIMGLFIVSGIVALEAQSLVNLFKLVVLKGIHHSSRICLVETIPF